MTPTLQNMIMQFFSQIPEDVFDTRLKEIGIEENNIKKLKEMIKQSTTDDKEGRS